MQTTVVNAAFRERLKLSCYICLSIDCGSGGTPIAAKCDLSLNIQEHGSHGGSDKRLRAMAQASARGLDVFAGRPW